MLRLDRPCIDELGKPLKAAIVGPFHIAWKTAGRKLSHLEVIMQAVTADTLVRTPRIAAVAPFQVSLLIAFHG